MADSLCYTLSFIHSVICSLVCTLIQGKVTNTAESQNVFHTPYGTYFLRTVWNTGNCKAVNQDIWKPACAASIPFYFPVHPICPVKLNAQRP